MSPYLPAAFPPQQAAPALTRTEVEEKLRNVPVFTITDARGAPMLATPPGAKKPVTSVFIGPAAAQEFLANLKKLRPELAARTRITTISLVEIYRLAGRKDAPFLCQFVPDPAEAAAARALLPKGKTVQVPLFVGRSAEKNGLMTFKHEGKDLLPFYFSKADLDAVLAKFSGVTGAPQGLTVQVVDLLEILASLTASPDKGMAQVTLIPSRAAAEYVQAQGKAVGKP